MENSEFIQEQYKFDDASAKEVRGAIAKVEQSIAELKSVLVNIERNRTARYLYDSGLSTRKEIDETL